MLERCDVLYVCVCGEYLFYPDVKINVRLINRSACYQTGHPLINRVPAYQCSLIFYHVEHIDLRDWLWKKAKRRYFWTTYSQHFPLERNAQVIRH